MSGEVEYGNCDICNIQNTLNRKYYYYDIHCECCSNDDHFEIVRYCNYCNPKLPSVVNVVIKHKSSR